MKRHLSVANVLSLIALFVALSASAVAATKLSAGQVKSYNIAKQAVTNSKIKTQAVTSGKIKNLGINANDLGTNSVINSKIKKKAVTNSKIGNKAVNTRTLGIEAVTAGRLAPEAVSAGKLSAALYSQLVKNVAYVTETSVNDSATEKSVTALCPAGKEVIGGGARINSPASVAVANSGNYPLVNASNSRVGWIATGRETPEEGGNWQVVAYAICAEL